MAQSLVIEHARVFDGVNILEDASVVVRDGRIVGVGSGPEVHGGTDIVHAEGMTLLPGLFDAHFHALGRPDSLHEAAIWGIATVIDMGCSGKGLKGLKSLAARSSDLADVYGASQPAVASDAILKRLPGLEDMPAVDSPGGAESWVNERLAEGSDFIKVVYDAPEGGSLTEDTLEAIVRAAHARGIQVWVHALQEEKARRAVEAGADGLAHIIAGDSAGSDFGRFLAEHGTVVVPTLVCLLNTKVGEPQVEPMLADDRLRPFIDPQKLRLWPARPELNHLRKGMSEAIKLIAEAGVTVLAGTDASPFPVGLPRGSSLHRELELLVQEGLTPVQALTSATSAPARAFRMPDRGCLRPGLRADMLLVEGDPTSDITCTRNIRGIWKAGVALAGPGRNSTQIR
jgi:imidazolonepropionase-like amidohydrolase